MFVKYALHALYYILLPTDKVVAKDVSNNVV